MSLYFSIDRPDEKVRMKFVRCATLNDRVDKRALVIQRLRKPTPAQEDEDIRRALELVVNYFEQNNLDYDGNDSSVRIKLPHLDPSMQYQLVFDFDVKPKPQ